MPSAHAETDLALIAPTPNFDPGVQYATYTRTWQGIPGIERSPGGRLWAVWYSGGKGEGSFNYMVVVTSDNNGYTWSPPRIVVDPPATVRAYDPCPWVDPTGRLWLFWAQSNTHWDGRSGTWAITSDNPDAEKPTWSAPRRVANGIMMCKPTALSDGRWLLPAAIWNRRPFRQDMDAERFSNVYVSEDQGANWTLLGGADVPNRVFDEHMVVERKDGSLWMLVRTNYGIGESISRDGGRTWSPGQDSGIAGPNSRFFFRRLKSGRMLMINHVNFTRRSHMTACLSEDDGKTWPHQLLLDEREMVSYPDGTQAPDGQIFVIYDRDRYGAGDILMAAIREEDIIAGKIVSHDSRLRVRVDHLLR